MGGVAHALHGGILQGTASSGLGASVKAANNLNKRFSKVRFRHSRAVQGNPRSILVRRNKAVGSLGILVHQAVAQRACGAILNVVPVSEPSCLGALLTIGGGGALFEAIDERPPIREVAVEVHRASFDHVSETLGVAMLAFEGIRPASRFLGVSEWHDGEVHYTRRVGKCRNGIIDAGCLI